MENNRKNPGAPRGPGPVDPNRKPAEQPPEEEDPPEETTNPGVDPLLREALESLHRVQVDTRQRASDVEGLLIKRKTPFPR